MYPSEIKLSKGSDLLESLQKISVEKKRSGYILGIVGDLSKVVFKCPNQNSPKVIEDKLEIISLSGRISPEMVHLHISISDSDCTVWGGHLEKGSKILKQANVLIGFLNSNELIEERYNQKGNNGKNRIEIAIVPNCPWSERSIKILRTLSIPHTIYLIDNDTDYKKIRERSNLSSFPQIFIDEKLIGGYDELTQLHGSGQLETFRD